MNAFTQISEPQSLEAGSRIGCGVTDNQERTTIFSPEAQGIFLEHLSTGGNVRLACRACGVSPQTAYRARRKSPALAALWDAALVSARVHAADVLANRALDGLEEAVFYHGEEVARCTRYSDRLLLAHLARLDRLAEREEVRAAEALLDGAIDTLRKGEEVDAAVCEQLSARASAGAHDGEKNNPQDRVPCVPSPPETPPAKPLPSSSAAVGHKKCPDCGGMCATPYAVLGPEDCDFYDNRMARMEAARPAGAADAWTVAVRAGLDPAKVADLQLEAFEAEGHEWWLVTSDAEVIESVLYNYPEERAANAPAAGD